MAETIEITIGEPYKDMLDQLQSEYGDVQADLSNEVETIIHQSYQQL